MLEAVPQLDPLLFDHVDEQEHQVRSLRSSGSSSVPPESVPQLHSPQETEVLLVPVLSRKPQPRPGGQALERSALSVLAMSSTQTFESVGDLVRPALAEPEDDEDFPLQGSFPDCVHGSCADASGCTGEFVVPVAGSGSRYLNGVNSFSGGVGEHDTPADATATLSPPCQQRR